MKKETKYFFRRNKIDFTTLLTAITLYLLAYLYTEDPKVLLALSIIVTLVSALVIIYTRLRERDFHFISLTKRKHKDQWIGRGTFEYDKTKKCFRITQSEAGFIFSKCLTWSDYKYEFHFQILKKSVGAIVRAVNLSNLVMLQIFDYGIKPHVRINGAWNAWDPFKEKLDFTEKLNIDKWYRCLIQCCKDSLNIRIFEEDQKEHIFDREWKIPHGSIIFALKKDEEGEPTHKIPFSINLEYGTVGFRNCGSESALVKDVLVEKT